MAVVKNAALSRALRRKDQDMNQLILMVSLQRSNPAQMAHLFTSRHSQAVA